MALIENKIKQADGELFIIPQQPSASVKMLGLSKHLEECLFKKIAVDKNAKRLKRIPRNEFAKTIIEHKKRYSKSSLDVTAHFWERKRVKFEWSVIDITTQEIRHTPPVATIWLAFRSNLFHCDAIYQEIFWEKLAEKIGLEKVKFTSGDILVPIVMKGEDCPIEVFRIVKGGTNGNGQRFFVSFAEYNAMPWDECFNDIDIQEEVL